VQHQDIATVALFADIPSDYRISGLAFRFAFTRAGVARLGRGRYARSGDGDWFEIQHGRMRPVWADAIETRLLVSGARYITELLGER
jgi:hypothetical protein